MSHVLSLVVAKSKALLTAGDVDAAQRALEAVGARGGSVDSLAKDEAADISFEDRSVAALATVRSALAGKAIDVNVVAAAGRRKKLLVADMDSTMIEQECIDELAGEIGRRAEVAAITERAMRGEIAFEPALRERVALFRGLPADIVDKVLASRISIMPGAVVLVATMRAARAHTMLVTGGFRSFAEPIARRIGFHSSRSNILLSEADKLTGEAREPILGQAAKEEALAELTAKLGLDPGETLSVGDGANDLGMIKRAGLGVAYRGKPALRAAADAIIDHADLTGLLFLQGYRREEFVETT